MICIKLHYNGSNSFLFFNAVKMHQFKVKDSEIFQKIEQLIAWKIHG